MINITIQSKNNLNGDTIILEQIKKAIEYRIMNGRNLKNIIDITLCENTKKAIINYSKKQSNYKFEFVEFNEFKTNKATTSILIDTFSSLNKFKTHISYASCQSFNFESDIIKCLKDFYNENEIIFNEVI